MALPKGKSSLNNTNATSTVNQGLPVGPNRIKTKIETPQGAGSCNKKGPGLGVGEKPCC